VIGQELLLLVVIGQ